MTRLLDPYDAVLLISFGGPDSPAEVMPFLRRVTAGRGVPQERLDEVAERYLKRGGISPINAETQALAAALGAELGPEVPLEIGNRNSRPFLAEALERLVAQGARRILGVSTSAYPSYPSCRQYQENLAEALLGVPAEVTVDRIGPYAHHPGFAAANSAAVAAALAELSDTGPTQLVFVTHSLPETLARTSGPAAEPGSYVAWHRTLAGHIAEEVSRSAGRELPWSLAYCSRSGSPHQPWLEPDVNDLLTDLAEQGTAQVVLAPIGFTSDHMEVVWDLDVEAVPHAQSLGMQVRRAETARTHPDFVHALAGLLFEAAALARGEEATPLVIDGGRSGHNLCSADCCPAPALRVSRERSPVPALPGPRPR